MTDWANPDESSFVTLNLLDDTREKALHAASLDYTSDTNLQSGMIRLLRGGSNTVTVQEYNGSTWVTQTILAASIGSLAASIITSGTLADARIPSLNASKTTAGTFADARIPNLDASKTTSGVFADARIPSMDAAKINSGTFAIARIPTIDSTRHGVQTSGTLHAAATTSVNGFMSAADKTKVNELPIQRIVALSADTELADFSLESSAWAPMSGMTLKANTYYRLDFFIMMEGANGATSQIRICGADQNTASRSFVRVATDARAASPVLESTFYITNDLDITAITGTPEYVAKGTNVILTGGSATTLHVGLRNTSGGALDVYRGSHVIVTELTSTV